MEIKGKKVLVLGLARTGRECARFLAQRGASVQVTDVRSEEELKQEMETLAALPIRYFLGGEDPDWLEGVDIIVPSPVVPAENVLLKEGSRRGIKILSEPEFSRLLPGEAKNL